MTRGSWELIDTVDSGINWSRGCSRSRAKKKLLRNLRTKYSAPGETSDRAGFIVLLDKRLVIFYTNDLARTPSTGVQGGDTSEANVCCHGLYPMRRWTGSEVMHRKIIMAPVIVATYNTALTAWAKCAQQILPVARRYASQLSRSLGFWIFRPKTHLR